MKKLTYLVASFIVFSNVLLAQDIDSKEALLDTVANEACECINKKTIDFETVQQSRLEMEFGLCILESYSKHKKEADKYFTISLTDEQSLEALGADVAIKMMGICSDFMMKVVGTYTASEFEEGKDDIIIVGQVTNIQESLFNTIELKDTDNRMQKILWLEYFEGDHLLYDLNKLKKMKVKITCYEYEMFDPKIKEYRNFKIIKKISVL